MVQVAICWCGEFQGSKANVVQGFIVNTIGLVCVFNELVNRKGGIVGFYYCIGYLKSEKKMVGWLK